MPAMTATEKRSLSDRAVELGLEATVVREILATTATMLDAVHWTGQDANVLGPRPASRFAFAAAWTDLGALPHMRNPSGPADSKGPPD